MAAGCAAGSKAEVNQSLDVRLILHVGGHRVNPHLHERLLTCGSAVAAPPPEGGSVTLDGVSRWRR